MEEKSNASQSSKISVSTFNEKGEETTEHFYTTLPQSLQIEQVANSLSEKGLQLNRINKAQAQQFTGLIEQIIGKMLKKTNEEKFMTNSFSNYILYGDLSPTDGGTYLKIDL